MDRFLRFNRKNVDDRQIDTLIGISKGIVADGVVNQREAEFLHSWLIQSQQATENPLILDLLETVSGFLEDGILDAVERERLQCILQAITGAPAEVGELAKTASLPLDRPPPRVVFPGRTFLFTGTCAYGTRKQCYDATQGLGGQAVTRVTLELDFLVLGTYVTDSWIHETFGRKIEKAISYRDRGCSLRIVSEEQWATAGNLIAVP
jgi:NAD-dependent DNA ligase